MLVADTLTTFTLNSCYKYNVFRHVVKKKVAISRCFRVEVVRVADSLQRGFSLFEKKFLIKKFSQTIRGKEYGVGGVT